MKTLFVLRHAKSSWRDETLADHDRPLNKRGQKAAPKMGRWARVNEVWPDVVLSSTALRAQLTAEAFISAGKYESVAIESKPALYEASADTIIDVLQARKEHAVMLVGHNPSLEDLVVSLTNTEVRFVTAAFAWIELPIENWPELCVGVPGYLREFWIPRKLP